MKICPTNMDLFLESYWGDDMRYGQDYDKYICDDRDTLEYVLCFNEERQTAFSNRNKITYISGEIFSTICHLIICVTGCPNWQF